MIRTLLATTLLVSSAYGVAIANGEGEKCFDKGTLTYVDCPQEAPPPAPVPEPVVNWTGPYIGLHGGYAWSDFDGDDGDGLDLDPDGGLVGIQAGYLHQYDNDLVIGVEIDGSLVFADDSISAAFPIGDDTFTATVSADLDCLASARLRLGVAVEELLPYITGGAALGCYEISASASTSQASVSASEDEVAFGGVVGGGLEYMLDDHWRVRAEGLYYIFDDELDDVDFGLNDVIVGRVGASYRF